MDNTDNVNMFAPERLQAILRDMPWHLRLPGGLEEAYSQRELPSRLRAIFLGVLVAIPLYLLTCLLELIYLPEMLQTNLPVRVLVIGLLLVILVLLQWSPVRRRAEQIAVCFALVLSAAQVPIALFSPAPYQALHFVVMVLPIVYLGTVIRVGFLYTLCASLLMLSGKAAAVFALSGMDSLQAAFTVQLALSFTILLLISNYLIERMRRRQIMQSWLLGQYRKALDNEQFRETGRTPGAGTAGSTAMEAELRRRLDMLAEVPSVDTSDTLPSARLVLRYSFALLLVRMDDREQFRKLYGDRETDFCITTMVRITRKLLSGPEDLAMRLENDTLALILQGVSASDAENIGQRILRDVRTLGIPHYGTEWRENVTASCGVLHSSDLPARDPRGLVLAAEKALEEAVETGGDRCVRYRKAMTGEVAS